MSPLVNGFLHYVLWALYTSLSSCTDLAGVYQNKIFILRDADIMRPNSTSLEYVTLSTPLTHPMALTQDIETNRLFVAETMPSYETLIFAITLNSEYKMVNMTSAVQEELPSEVEGIAYNPKSNTLYWTDATNHCLYKASVPTGKESGASWPHYIRDLGRTFEPRGIAFDSHNEVVYWSERSKSRSLTSSIETWNPANNSHDIFQQDSKHFYQGMTFDETSGSLIWAVTDKWDYNSSCRIVSTSVKENHHHEIVRLDNCYPFSIVVDEQYVYWADLSRHGIMRASRSNLLDIVKLVHTPPVKNKIAYDGVLGLAKLSARKDKKKENYHSGNTKLHNTPEPSDPGNKGLDNTTEPADSGNKELHNTPEPVDPRNQGSRNTSELADHKEPEEISKNVNKSRVDNLDFRRNSSKYEYGNSSTVKSEGEAITESVHIVTEPYNDKTQTVTSVLSSTTETTSIEWYEEVHVVIILTLTAIIVVFLISTIILLVLMYRRKTQSYEGVCRGNKAESPEAVVVQARPRQVNRFRPKKSIVSKNKSGHSGSSTCSEKDGVSINIEDCCQMTLCETPCYTSVKKQGKSYKKTKKGEDNKGLLDDNEEV